MKDDLAILVDGDQLPPGGLPALIKRLQRKWQVSERVIVRNWRSTKDQKEWRAFAADHGFRLYQRDPVATGKNAADIELAVTAMDLLHERGIRAFCLVTGDSDFTPVVERLRRADCHVEQVQPTELAADGAASKTRRSRRPASRSATSTDAAPAASKPRVGRGRRKRGGADNAAKEPASSAAKTPAQKRDASKGATTARVAVGRRGAQAPIGLSDKQIEDLRNAYRRHVRRAIDALMKRGDHQRGWVSANRVGSILGEEGVRRENHGFAKTRPLHRVLEDLGFATEQTETGGYQVKME